MHSVQKVAFLTRFPPSFRSNRRVSRIIFLHEIQMFPFWGKPASLGSVVLSRNGPWRREKIAFSWASMREQLAKNYGSAKIGVTVTPADTFGDTNPRASGDNPARFGLFQKSPKIANVYSNVSYENCRIS
jgi:hypothetical protein